MAFGYKHVLHRHLQRVHGVAPAEEDVDKEKDDDEETNQESKRKKLRYSSGEMLVATPLDLSIVILCRPCNDVTNPDAMQ